VKHPGEPLKKKALFLRPDRGSRRGYAAASTHRATRQTVEKDVAGVHKTLWPEETAREQILQVDFLVNYSRPPGVEGHDPLKWERWRRGYPEEQVLDAPPPDPGKEKS
jgi:hypothetical protein